MTSRTLLYDTKKWINKIEINSQVFRAYNLLSILQKCLKIGEKNVESFKGHYMKNFNV